MSDMDKNFEHLLAKAHREIGELSRPDRATSWVEGLETLDGDVSDVVANRATARRHARAIELAVAAQTRIEALAEALEDSEYFRMGAEGQLELMKQELPWRDVEVVTAIDDMPPDVTAAISLASGRVYLRKPESELSPLEGTWTMIGHSGRDAQYSGDPRVEDGPYACFDDRAPVSRLAKEHTDNQNIRRKLLSAIGQSTNLDKPDVPVWDVVKDKYQSVQKDLRDAQGAMRDLAKQLSTANASMQKICGLLGTDDFDAAVRALEEHQAAVAVDTDGAQHQLVKRAEQSLLDGATVLDDGSDPTYTAESLHAAIKLLKAALPSVTADLGAKPNPAVPAPPPF